MAANIDIGLDLPEGGDLYKVSVLIPLSTRTTLSEKTMIWVLNHLKSVGQRSDKLYGDILTRTPVVPNIDEF